MKRWKSTTVTGSAARIAAALAAAAVVAVTVSCGSGDTSAPTANLLSGSSDGSASVNPKLLAQAMATLPQQSLSGDEVASLQFSREEEKLARDVYALFATLWPLQIFPNIEASEQTHTDAVLTLLERYSVPDPADGLAPGVFQNTTLQTLYNELVARGRISMVAALTVGAEIEEIDIGDLTAELAKVDNADIVTVFENLRAASGSHLRSFVSALATRGVTYEPKYLSQEVYDEIIASPASAAN